MDTEQRRPIDRNAPLIARLAHDFGNYLTGVLGFAELALAQQKPNTPVHRYLTEVINSAKSGASWVYRLQVISRRSNVSCLPSCLATAIDEQASRVKERWGSNVSLKTNVPASIPLLAVDAMALREALTELLDNAREAIAVGGQVTLDARTLQIDASAEGSWLGGLPAGNYAEITVEDNGCGIAPDVGERLLNEILFADKPRHRGLGLAMVYSIAHNYGGGMGFGPHPAKGSRVRLAFPLAAAESPSPTGKSGARVS